MLAAWKQGRGTFSLAVSTTPWLNNLMGLPFLLEYPHGCLEQKASRLLGYTFLGGLLDYLPDSQAEKPPTSMSLTRRCANLRRVFLLTGASPIGLAERSRTTL